jgi:hypothetical protein
MDFDNARFDFHMAFVNWNNQIGGEANEQKEKRMG